MIRQSQEGEESEKHPRNDTREEWRQVVEGWEIPTGNFPMTMILTRPTSLTPRTSP